MDLKRELLGVIEALNRAKVEYALCGGMAVVLHGSPRLTRDIDLLIRRDDLERVKKALEAAGFTVPGGVIPFDAGKEHEREVFRVSKADGGELLTVDLLLLPTFLADVWEDRVVFEFEGVPVTVVSRNGLIRMKRIAGRPQDLRDAEDLESAGGTA
jgi:hypothetical protein